MISHFTVEIRPPARPDAIQPVDVYSASPGFMATLGVPLVRGRDFQISDQHNAVVISEGLARALLLAAEPDRPDAQLPGRPGHRDWSGARYRAPARWRQR